MDKMITCYSPNIVNNLYAVNVRRLIENAGYKTTSLKEVLKNPRLFVSCKVFNFNWFENVNSRKQYYAKSILLDFLHLSNKGIIYTLHNKKPHNDGANYWSGKMMKKMCSLSDRIVGLCPDTFSVVESIMPEATSKLVIIPHPNYIENYKNINCDTLRSEYGFSADDLVFLFVGFVSPYKNLELLIDTFNEIKNPKIKLLIAGKPCDSEYREKLEKQIGESLNIRTDFRYIPDGEMASFYKTGDIVVLPYHKTSSLNSGAVYLTFSFGKTVICPDIGTINALKDTSFVYTYHYDDEKEHAGKLHEAIMRVCSDYENDPASVIQKGQKAYAYVEKEHEDRIIEEKYAELYQQIISEKEHKRR